MLTCTVLGFLECTRNRTSTSVGRVFRKSRRVSKPVVLSPILMLHDVGFNSRLSSLQTAVVCQAAPLRMMKLSSLTSPADAET